MLLVALLFVAACSEKKAAPTSRPTDTPPQEADQPTASATPMPTKAAPTRTPREEKEGPAPTSAGSVERLVDEDDWHVLGSANAPVTIVEYSDFQ